MQRDWLGQGEGDPLIHCNLGATQGGSRGPELRGGLPSLEFMLTKMCFDVLRTDSAVFVKQSHRHGYREPGAAKQGPNTTQHLLPDSPLSPQPA